MGSRTSRFRGHVGVHEKHGLYVHGQADLKSLSVDGECRKDGSIPSTGDTPYYTGSEKYSRYAFLAGGIHSIALVMLYIRGVGLRETASGVGNHRGVETEK